MPLKITLKPREKLLIGGALLTNGDQPAAFTVENEVPMLRQRDLLAARDATTVCRRIYYTIQLMYFEPQALADHHQAYWRLVRRLTQAAPSALPLVEAINEQIVDGRYYQALKLARRLIAFEDNLLQQARP